MGKPQFAGVLKRRRIYSATVEACKKDRLVLPKTPMVKGPAFRRFPPLPSDASFAASCRYVSTFPWQNAPKASPKEAVGPGATDSGGSNAHPGSRSQSTPKYMKRHATFVIFPELPSLRHLLNWSRHLVAR